MRPLERDAFVAALRERASAREATAFEATAENLFPPDAREPASPAAVRAAAARVLGAPVGASFVARVRHLAASLAEREIAALPTTRETLERIDSLGIPTAVLCDGWSRVAHREAACVGFSGRVLVSEDIGSEKPDPRAFEALARIFGGIPRDRIWYVGSDPRRDIDGAFAAGLTPIWLRADGASYPPGLEPPALSIATLADLLPPLCEEYTRSLLSLRQMMRTGLEWRDGHVIRARDDS